MRVWRPLRRRRSRKLHGVVSVDVRGMDVLRSAWDGSRGVLITPNHASHADPFALIEAADQLRTPFYFMTAWQVFAMTHRLGRRVLSHHGCFSINREGHDTRALRFAVRALETPKRPLVIFPEGEVYHLNDRVMPFRRGAATAAMLAAERSRRPILCVPCGLKFQFVNDPTVHLLDLTSRLERALLWTPRTSDPLPKRVHRLVEGVVALQEMDIQGRPQEGSLGSRIGALIEEILAKLEEKHRAAGRGSTIPERVKRLRFSAIRQIENAADSSAERACGERDLNQLFLAMQLFSYPIDYLDGEPSIERLSETLDKLEEDILGAATAGVRGHRRATVLFGEPIAVEPAPGIDRRAANLTARMEASVQALLDELNASSTQTAFAKRTPIVRWENLEPALAAGA